MSRAVKLKMGSAAPGPSLARCQTANCAVGLEPCVHANSAMSRVPVESVERALRDRSVDSKSGVVKGMVSVRGGCVSDRSVQEMDLRALSVRRYRRSGVEGEVVQRHIVRDGGLIVVANSKGVSVVRWNR